MSYKDIKVTDSGSFYIESKDLFKDKEKALKLINKLRNSINNERKDKRINSAP